MAKRPSQLDIATAAGVSQTVVSHVLNGKGRQYGIAKATEVRVRTALDELGYAPNIAARALRSGRNGLIGVHTFETLFPTDQDSYYFDMMIGVEEMAIELGQDLVLLTSVHQPSGDARIYQAGRNRLRITDGAVMLGFDQDDDDLARLAAEGFPFVFVGRREHAAALMPYVTVDYAGGVTTVVQRMAAHGHRRIAYLAAPQRREPQVERLSAVRAAATSLDVEVETRFIDPSDLTSALVDELRATQVTAMIAETSPTLSELSRICAADGVDIPGDLSVACLDAPAGDQYLDWTHISVPLRQLGGRAVALLLDLLDERVGVDHADVLPCPIHEGRTVGPRTGR